MRAGLLGGIPAPPPPGRLLWATLGLLAFTGLNLVFQTELWPHTPAAAHDLGLAASLAGLLALPQLLRWAWHWLRTWAGPWWLALPLKIAFVAALLPAAVVWLLGAGLWVVVVANG